MNNDLDFIIEQLEGARKTTKKGGEYWMGRKIQNILGYSEWENFQNVIGKARMACKGAKIDPNNHFLDTTNMIKAGKGAMRKRGDYYLTRYACYLIAMNGDSNKLEIATAQTYFAVQARRQEIQDKLTADERRLMLRERVSDATKSLNSTAKKIGVQKYGVFQNAGYLGLYEMGLSEIKKHKDIPKKDSLFDRAGRTELAANEFRLTQTEDKIIRENIRGEKQAIETHRKVGSEVRSTIKKLGGIMPEDLPTEPSIKKLQNKKKKELK